PFVRKPSSRFEPWSPPRAVGDRGPYSNIEAPGPSSAHGAPARLFEDAESDHALPGGHGGERGGPDEDSVGRRPEHLDVVAVDADRPREHVALADWSAERDLGVQDAAAAGPQAEELFHAHGLPRRPGRAR